MPTQAHAEEDAEAVQACAQAYEQAQVARNNGKLVEAQEHLRVCVQESCPDFVKTDCGQWLSDIKRDMPSVIFSVVDSDGKERTDAKVTVDGTEVPLDGRAMELDPGQHEVTTEFEGKTTAEKVVVRQGEKNRVVKLEIDTAKDSDGDGVMDGEDACPDEAGTLDANGCPAAAPPPKAAAQGMDPMRLGAYIGWGVGGAGLITGAVFGYLGSQADEEARQQCLSGTPCTEETRQELVDDVDQKNLIANIGWGVGIAGAVTGTVLFILSIQNEKTAAAPTETGLRLDVQPLNEGGGVFSFSGAF